MGIFAKLSASILPTNKCGPLQLHNLQQITNESKNNIIL